MEQSRAIPRQAPPRARTTATAGSGALAPAYAPRPERIREGPPQTHTVFVVNNHPVRFGAIVKRLMVVVAVFAVAIFFVSRNASITRLSHENQGMQRALVANQETIGQSEVYTAMSLDRNEVMVYAQEQGLLAPDAAQILTMTPRQVASAPEPEQSEASFWQRLVGRIFG